MVSNTKSILVVDDEPKIVEVVKSYLEKSGFEVFEALSGYQAFLVFEKVKPSLVILDLMLPDMSGEDICKTLRKKSKVPIIMLTAKIEEEDILKGLGSGADDYITKPFSPRQLIARVEALLRRTEDFIEIKTNKYSFNNNDLTVDTFNYEVKKKGEIINLTPNEYKILSTLVKFPKKTFTREELITYVSRSEFGGFDRIIDQHIKNIRQKIESDLKNPKYILTVHGIGYRFGGEQNEI